jgi:exoribonuclease R
MKENKYLEGIYRRNAKGFGFVKIEDQEDEIYISKDKSKNALNEDKVLVEVIEEKSRKQKCRRKNSRNFRKRKRYSSWSIPKKQKLWICSAR